MEWWLIKRLALYNSMGETSSCWVIASVVVTDSQCLSLEESCTFREPTHMLYIAVLLYKDLSPWGNYYLEEWLIVEIHPWYGLYNKQQKGTTLTFRHQYRKYINVTVWISRKGWILQEKRWGMGITLSPEHNTWSCEDRSPICSSILHISKKIPTCVNVFVTPAHWLLLPVATCPVQTVA